MKLTCLLLLALFAGASAADLPCPFLAKAPVVDGDLADWPGESAVVMSEVTNVKDLRVERAVLGWDDAKLYFGLHMRDSSLLNEGRDERIVKGDCAELRLILPAGDVIRLSIAPISAGGTPALHLSRRAPNQPGSELAAASDPGVVVNGVLWAVRTDDKNWIVEAAVPRELIGMVPGAEAGYPFVVVAWDHDAPGDWDPWHRRSESANQKKPEIWPRLVLTK